MKCLRCGGSLIDEPKEMVRYGLHVGCFAEWFELKADALTLEFTDFKRHHPPSSAGSHFTPENDSFFQGKYRKYSVNLNGEEYLLKMRQDEAPELPEVEYLCNQIGRQLSIPVAPFYFVELNGDRTFVTRNFITSRKKQKSDLQHIYHFRLNEQHNCEGLIQTVKNKTVSPFFVEVLVKTIMFDALIGNNDRHGRNLAFINTVDGYELSPIYDNVSYLSLESGGMLKADWNPSGRISTQATDAPGMFDYVHELIRLGYKEEVRSFFQNVQAAQFYIFNMIDNSFCSDLMKDALTKLVKKRQKELQDALSIEA